MVQLELSYITDGTAKEYNDFGKCLNNFLFTQAFPINLEIPRYSRKMETHAYKLYTNAPSLELKTAQVC